MKLPIARCGRARTRSATLDVCAAPLAPQAFRLRSALLKPALAAVITTMCLSACASVGRKPGASRRPGVAGVLHQARPCSVCGGQAAACSECSDG